MLDKLSPAATSPAPKALLLRRFPLENLMLSSFSSTAGTGVGFKVREVGV